jgi:hypothetical protein
MRQIEINLAEIVDRDAPEADRRMVRIAVYQVVLPPVSSAGEWANELV